MAKMLDETLKNKLLRMKPEEFTVSKITELFGTHATRDGKVTPPMYPQDAIVNLKPNEYINKTEVRTNAGKILFNKICIEGKIDFLLENGYYNDVLTKKKYGQIEKILSAALISKKLDIVTLNRFLKAFEFYGLKMCPIFSPSFTEGILKPIDSVQMEKEKILKEKEDAGQVMGRDDIIDLEDKLIALSAKASKGDPGMTLYDSGSRGAYDNDYKNIAVMIGPMANPETGEIELMKSNYMDGISREDIAKAANGNVNASHPRAVGTAVGGYLTKQFYSVYQSIQLDEKGTDCGSKFTLNILLTPENYSRYEFQFIVDKNKLVELNPNTKDRYMNTVVHLRSPMGCLGEKICNACAGNRYYYSDIQNAGLTLSRITNNLMNKQMKKFHNMKLHHKEVDPDSLLG